MRRLQTRVYPAPSFLREGAANGRGHSSRAAQEQYDASMTKAGETPAIHKGALKAGGRYCGA